MKQSLLITLFCATALTIMAQGTSFTYQGRLADTNGAATGSYDIVSTLWANSTGAPQIGGNVTNSGVSVTNGLFVMTLDFGAGIFTGPDRWLEISVRTNGAGGFT